MYYSFNTNPQLVGLRPHLAIVSLPTNFTHSAVRDAWPLDKSTRPCFQVFTTNRTSATQKFSSGLNRTQTSRHPGSELSASYAQEGYRFGF